MKNQSQKISSGPITPSDVAKYFLYRAINDGEVVSPLKMQKLVYYAYVWNLVKKKKPLFEEKIEAWPNGPVVPSLYRELKEYGSSPIDADFLNVNNESELQNKVISKFSSDIKSVLDAVYEKYMTLTAFELVVLTHSEKPWLEAREGLGPTENSNTTISDETILKYHGSKNK